MFTKIIVPVDGSDLAEQIVPYAVGLAQALSIPVELLQAVHPGHGEDQEGSAHVYLTGLAQGLRSQGKDVSTTVVAGPPVAAIVQQAQRAEGALVAMATHGRSGLARLLMGSVAGGVLHEGVSPLLLFKPQAGHSAPQQAPRTIIVPLDGSEFGERALTPAALLGRSLGARVVLARAVPMHDLAPTPAGPGVFLPTGADDHARAYLDAHAHSLFMDGVFADSVVLLGDPPAEIVRLATANADSMVLMTTHGYSGIARMVLGSVAEDIVRQCPSPVLLLRAT